MKFNKRNIKEIVVYTMIVMAILYAIPLLFSFVFTLLLKIEFIKVFVICDVLWHIGYIIAVNVFDIMLD